MCSHSVVTGRHAWDPQLDADEALARLMHGVPGVKDIVLQSNADYEVEEELGSSDDEDQDGQTVDDDETKFNKILDNFETSGGDATLDQEACSSIRGMRKQSSWNEFEDAKKGLGNKKQLSAIVDDCDRFGRSRKRLGALDMAEFEAILSQERYQAEWPAPNSDDIRRIYLTNLDLSAIYVLTSTADGLLSRALPSFVDNHIEGEAVIHTRLQSDGGLAFRFECHLPYFSYRVHSHIREDQRKRGNGKPIRSSRNISRLMSRGKKAQTRSKHVLYRASKSCIFVGFSSQRWTGCLVSDSYYMDPDEKSSYECIEYWDRERQGYEQPDPFTLGKTMADSPWPNVRDYYINSIYWQFRRVSFEQTKALRLVSQEMKDYLSNKEIESTTTRIYESYEDDSRTIEAAKERMAERKLQSSWMTYVCSVASELIDVTADLITELDSFIVVAQGIFCDSNSMESTRNQSQLRIQRVGQIEDIKILMSRQHRTILGLKGKFKERSQLVEKAIDYDLKVVDQAIANYQYSTARQMKEATVMALGISGVALAATILSTPAGYIPWANPSPGIFVALVLCAQFAIWVVWHLSSKLSDGWKRLATASEELRKVRNLTRYDLEQQNGRPYAERAGPGTGEEIVDTSELPE